MSKGSCYSDNGSGFASKILAEYLSVHGIKYIFARSYHPQGRGKIERFNRRIKEKVCLMVYCSPGEPGKALDEAIAIYNRTPHEALDNVSPNDVYAGRKEVVLQRRGAICGVRAPNKDAGFLKSIKVFTPGESSIYGLFRCGGLPKAGNSPQPKCPHEDGQTRVFQLRKSWGFLCLVI